MTATLALIAYLALIPVAALIMYPWAVRDDMIGPEVAAMFFALIWPVAAVAAFAWGIVTLAGRGIRLARPRTAREADRRGL